MMNYARLLVLAMLCAISVSCDNGEQSSGQINVSFEQSTSNQSNIDPEKSKHSYAALEKGAKKNDTWSQFYLGVLKAFPADSIYWQLENGLTDNALSKSPDKQLKQFREAMQLKERSLDPIEAVDLLEKASAAGCGPASFILGALYLENPHSLWDDEMGREKYVEYLELAHNQGYLVATAQIAGHILNGTHGYAKDAIKAKNMYLEVYEQGDALAARFLGFAYWDGKFGTNDIDKAIMYFSEAVSRQDKYAYVNLGIIYKDEGEIQKSIEAYESAVKLGVETGAINLGRALFDLYPKEYRDAGRAKKLLEPFALRSSGSTGDAAYILALIAESEADIEACIKWSTVAMNNGHAAAAGYKLAWAHIDVGAKKAYGRVPNEGVVFSDLDATSLSRALQAFKVSANDGNAWSAYYVADLISKGKCEGYVLDAYVTHNGDVVGMNGQLSGVFKTSHDAAIMKEAAGYICSARRIAVQSSDQALVRNCDSWLSFYRYTCY
ncbi:MAG: sel1 repeat family protein [Phycisphaeraceae bacterium]|nr:sel1 repeat family protein [Phycisphaerales bacterium]MCB9860861.1 sel1 repeat family protein [Phycisphaeraceae bacterium]